MHFHLLVWVATSSINSISDVVGPAVNELVPAGRGVIMYNYKILGKFGTHACTIHIHTVHGIRHGSHCCPYNNISA